MLLHVERAAFRLLEFILAAMLAAMVVMVFGNVVLRYLFNSGIDISEELSRYFFVWLTYIGAVVVARKNGHMGVDALVARFGARGRTVCLVITDLVIIGCCVLLVQGTWKQQAINATSVAPVTGISMIFVDGILYVAGVGIALVSVARIVRALTGHLGPHELAEFAGDYSGDISRDIRGHLE